MLLSEVSENVQQNQLYMCVYVTQGHKLSVSLTFFILIKKDILKKVKFSDVGLEKELEIMKNTASYFHTLWPSRKLVCGL